MIHIFTLELIELVGVSATSMIWIKNQYILINIERSCSALEFATIDVLEFKLEREDGNNEI